MTIGIPEIPARRTNEKHVHGSYGHKLAHCPDHNR
jgi:hypothetical protein